jgi:hypothetical protein
MTGNGDWKYILVREDFNSGNISAVRSTGRTYGALFGDERVCYKQVAPLELILM